MESVDHNYDLLIVGGGAAGFAAALAARDYGLKVLVIEKEPRLGGATALSGGTIWLPATPTLAAAGVEDSLDDARAYLASVVVPAPDPVDAAKMDAYLTSASTLAALLERHGLILLHSRGWSDYYAQRPGGKVLGRAHHVAGFDLRSLGDKAEWMVSSPLFAAAHSVEVPKLALGIRSIESILTGLRVFARAAVARLRGEKLRTRGQALIGGLLRAAIAQNITIWRGTTIRDLIVENSVVVGAVIDRHGKQMHIAVNKGVVLASGGFARNAQMRKAHQTPVGTDVTMAPAGDTGDAIAIATRVGAKTAFMDQSWWVPGTKTPNGAMLHVWDRCFPHSLIVDARGDRYMDEAGPYMEVGQQMIARHRSLGVDHSWLVLESRHRRRYAFGMAPPMITPQLWFDSGYLLRNDTIIGLANEMKINAAALIATLARFNAAVIEGVDTDFGRGSLPISRFYGDRRAGKNSNLGAITKSPFYAVKIYPGDVGTAGGLQTDLHARVLDHSMEPIAGLYAAGNAASPTFGAWYPGAGASIGPALMSGMLAARHAAGQNA